MGVEKNGELLFNGTEFQFCKRKMFWRWMDDGDGSAPMNSTLKNSKDGKFYRKHLLPQ